MAGEKRAVPDLVDDASDARSGSGAQADCTELDRSRKGGVVPRNKEHSPARASAVEGPPKVPRHRYFNTESSLITDVH